MSQFEAVTAFLQWLLGACGLVFGWATFGAPLLGEGGASDEKRP